MPKINFTPEQFAAAFDRVVASAPGNGSADSLWPLTQEIATIVAKNHKVRIMSKVASEAIVKYTDETSRVIAGVSLASAVAAAVALATIEAVEIDRLENMFDEHTNHPAFKEQLGRIKNGEF